MDRDALTIWIDDKARMAGFSGHEEFAAHFQLKRYRLRQMYQAAVKEFVPGVDAVTTLPKELRAQLKERNVGFSSIEPVVVQRSNDKQTTKGLFRLQDG